MTDHPMSQKMDCLATIADAKNGEMSGWTVATWLNKRRHPEGVRESLRALTNRGLIVMRPMDDPNDEFRKRFPDRLKAMYSIAKGTEAGNPIPAEVGRLIAGTTNGAAHYTPLRPGDLLSKKFQNKCSERW